MVPRVKDNNTLVNGKKTVSLDSETEYACESLQRNLSMYFKIKPINFHKIVIVVIYGRNTTETAQNTKQSINQSINQAQIHAQVKMPSLR